MFSAHQIHAWFGLPPDSPWAGVLEHFLSDSIKIIVLLFVMIFILGFLRTFLPQQRLRQWLAERGVMGNVYAALLGAVTPFCSCSSIPLFLSFLKTGIPLGVAFSFLIASPLIDQYLVVLMLGFFGWKITVAYVVSGLLIGIVGGIILGKMNIAKYIMSDFAVGHEQLGTEKVYREMERVKFGFQEALEMLQKIWLWILVGIGIGALIDHYLQPQTIQTLLNATGWFSVPLATVIGVPIYGSCVAIIPIALVLFEKGVPLGTAMAFMMGVAALSLPEGIILSRAMRLPLIFLFFGITSLAIIFTGYLLNFLQPFLIR